jgi:uncharacterized protein
MGEAAKTPGGRALSALEFALAAGVVLGHNVWRVLPNEVPILVIAGLVSVRVRERGWAALGFRRPRSWQRVALIAAAAAGLRIIVSYPIEAALMQIWPPPVEPALATSDSYDLAWVASTLALVWVFAAFGEEIAYRGYLTLRGADALGGSRLAWWAAMIATAVLFGYGHAYKGPIGIVDSGIAGLILGAAYLLSGRCLWTAILAHGLIDTTAVMIIYLGLEA